MYVETDTEWVDEGDKRKSGKANYQPTSRSQSFQYTFVSLPLLSCICVKCNFSYLHNCRQQIAQNKVEILQCSAVLCL